MKTKNKIKKSIINKNNKEKQEKTLIKNSLELSAKLKSYYKLLK